MITPPAVTIATDNPQSYAGFINRLYVPPSSSHKGQNGRILIIGGSSLFHSAVLWPAEAASHFADMVHVASVDENNEIIRQIKVRWRNGIVIPQKELEAYIAEDDAILMGNGMMRTETGLVPGAAKKTLQEVLDISNEGDRTYYMADYLLHHYPSTKWVLDAGALQMMKAQWLSELAVPAVITPHQKEFETLFGKPVADRDEREKIKAVSDMAKRFHTVIILKAVVDIVSDGDKTFVIRGGNTGLTRGGTGDILAGIIASLYAKNSHLESVVTASLLLKLAAEDLSRQSGIWYNNSDLLSQLPRVMHRLMRQHNKAYRSII